MATINGNSGNNNLIGTSARDTLNGFGGNDTLNGGAGIDTLVGGEGNDIYIVDTTTDIIREDSGGGARDTVRASVSYTLVDNYLNDLTLTGTGAINGTGNSYDNIITGNNANNILDGRGGIDTLIGGRGNDTYIVDSITDEIVEYSSGGTDTVQSSVSYTLDAYVNNLVLTGTSAIDGIGNNLDNSLSGNSANNILYGGDGNDTLTGSEGDRLFGAAGNDYLTGGAYDGPEIYMDGDEGNDILLGDFANMYGGNGNDYLSSSFSGNQYGGNGNDTLDGDDRSRLDGGAGNDVLYVSESRGDGGDGDDVLIATSFASISGGNGNDTLTGGGYTSYAFNNPREGVDTITNFFLNPENQEDRDQIVVSANGFGGELTAGAVITADQFVRGTVAADVSDRFIYNNATGALFFDPTGSNNGANDQVRFATLVGAPGITNSNIFVDV